MDIWYFSDRNKVMFTALTFWEKCLGLHEPFVVLTWCWDCLLWKWWNQFSYNLWCVKTKTPSKPRTIQCFNCYIVFILTDKMTKFRKAQLNMIQNITNKVKVFLLCSCFFSLRYWERCSVLFSIYIIKVNI